MFLDLDSYGSLYRSLWKYALTVTYGAKLPMSEVKVNQCLRKPLVPSSILGYNVAHKALYKHITCTCVLHIHIIYYLFVMFFLFLLIFFTIFKMHAIYTFIQFTHFGILNDQYLHNVCNTSFMKCHLQYV